MTPPTDERVKELYHRCDQGSGLSYQELDGLAAICSELLATRQALREAGEALRAGADSLLVEQTRWERRRHISGLLSDKLTAEKIGAQSAQLRALAGPLPPLPTLPEMGKERE
jgi:hypothetical protein